MSIEKRVLLYLGKFPGYGFDVDGGSILAKQLIDTLKSKCKLDVSFIRKHNEEYIDEQVSTIRYFKYLDADNNKFIRRLENTETNKMAIGDYEGYEHIIAAHISKFFGLEDMPENFWAKTILFPMYCTHSYKKSGEYVPREYTERERIIMHKTPKIIVPSQQEKQDIISAYGVIPDKIKVIFRGIAPVFCPPKEKIKDTRLHIVCIGSIKKQKNNLDALIVLSKLIDDGIDADLNLVCTIQDNELYTQILSYIREHNLIRRVHFYFGLDQKAIADLLHKMDINISVSNWETFGRGIFEGVSSGLPTFVYSRLKCVYDICNGNQGVYFVDNADDMARRISAMHKDENLYNEAVKHLPSLAETLSYESEKNNLLNAILNNSDGV